MRITRRELAAWLAVAAGPWLAAPAAAAPGQPQPGHTPDDELKAARDRMKANREALGQHQIAMATEPAFQFRA